MNVKSLLLAAAVASSFAGSAFANNYIDGAEVQVAQLSAPAVRTTARVAATEQLYTSRSDISAYVPVNTNDTRTRAEVRAETIRALNSGEARALSSAYAGSAK